MKITLHIWRQAHESDEGRFEIYQEDGVNGEMSFLEMLDVLNERLIAEGKEPVAFESDCREGICGACGMVLNGVPHGPKKAIAVCQLHMRSFSDGEGSGGGPVESGPDHRIRRVHHGENRQRSGRERDSDFQT